MAKLTYCPICKNLIKNCQCLYTGSAHPNREKEERVVLDHLYLLNKKQLKHLLQLQKYQCASYSDEELNSILEKLEKEFKGDLK